MNTLAQDYNAELCRVRQENDRLRTKVAALSEALDWFVDERRNEYRHLDRGISSHTPRGIALLKARAVLAKVK